MGSQIVPGGQEQFPRRNILLDAVPNDEMRRNFVVRLQEVQELARDLKEER
jgi:hypothetical protein